MKPLVLASSILAFSFQEGVADPLIFQNVRLIDGTGKPPVDAAVMVVRDGKIESIGKDADVPQDGDIIDLQGKMVMPALIAAHSHLGLINGTKAASSNVTEENVLRQLKKFGAYGIGTVVSLGVDGDFIYDLRERRRKDPSAGPAVLTAGLGFGTKDGMPPVAAGFDKVHRPGTAEEGREQVREMAKHKPDFVKMWIDHLPGENPSLMPDDVRRAVIDEARKNGIKVAAHVHDLADAKTAVREGADILAHSVRDQPVDDELIRMMKEKGTWYIPTLFLDEVSFAYADRPEWSRTDFFKRALEPGVEELIDPAVFKARKGGRETLQTAITNLNRLHQAGVKIGMGTDSGANPFRVQGFAEHRELQLMVSAGMTPLEVIHSATGLNAELTGVSKTTGTLEKGKQADFLILTADPSEDIRNTEAIESVWIAGKKQQP
jgi:imidazolonepropionase-like amidohydrolase